MKSFVVSSESVEESNHTQHNTLRQAQGER